MNKLDFLTSAPETNPRKETPSIGEHCSRLWEIVKKVTFVGVLAILGCFGAAGITFGIAGVVGLPLLIVGGSGLLIGAALGTLILLAVSLVKKSRPVSSPEQGLTKSTHQITITPTDHQDETANNQQSGQRTLPICVGKLPTIKKMEKNLKCAQDSLKVENSDNANTKKAKFSFKQESDVYRNHEETSGTSSYETLRNSGCSILGTELGIASSQGKRRSMEDEDLAVQIDFKIGSEPYQGVLSGVFDGHGGKSCSAFVKANIKDYMINALESYEAESLSHELVYHSFIDCVQKLHETFIDTKGPTANEFAGTTATISLIVNRTLYVANIGDSRTILIEKDEGNIVAMSDDAKIGASPIPSSNNKKQFRYNERFTKKVGKKGARIILNTRIQHPDYPRQSIAVGAAIGDPDYKMLSRVPQVTYFELEPSKSYCVVHACDGLWDVATTNAVGEAVREELLRNQPSESIAAKLVKNAIRCGSKDNVSAVVIVIPSQS